MLKFIDVTIRRGANVLVEHARFSFGLNHKIGLTGANGCGKSSLLGVILKQLEVDAGEVRYPDDWVIAHVAQETPNDESSALAYVLEGDAELILIQSQIEAAELSQDGARLGELHAALEVIDGYAAQSRAATLMAGLGFKENEINQPVNQFSGGWRMRLNLAQALMCRSDLLLLDEPTNHLDLDAVIWLQSWLEAYRGTLILISHDRIFLDSVVKHIAFIERQKLTVYQGNYSAFETQRAAQLAQHQAAFVKQQRDIQHMQDFVRRFKAKATKAKQAQSRVKMLARLERIAPAHVDSPFGFLFKSPDKLPGNLLNLEAAAVSYGATEIFSKANITVLAGDRIGLIGPNGAGKSTLLKLLAGDIALECGELSRAKDLRIGYFAQHQLDQLHTSNTPYQHVDELKLGLDEQAIYDHLGGFGFDFERVNDEITYFSGGEKARLVLALLVAQRPNLLLLDEPTNHLDIDMRHALVVALQSFEGALMVVSHDRFLLESVSDQFYLIADQRLLAFEGDLEDYRQSLDLRRSKQDSEIGLPVSGVSSQKDQRRQRADQRKILNPLRKEFRQLEKQMENLGAQSAVLDEKLSSPAIYEDTNKARLTSLLKEKGRLDSELEQAEDAWIEAGERLEAAML